MQATFPRVAESTQEAGKQPRRAESGPAQAEKPSVFSQLYFILKAHKFMLGIVFLLSIVLACLNMSVPYLIKIIIDDIIKSETLQSSLKLRYLMYTLLVYIAIITAKNAVYYVSKSRITILGEQVAFEVRNNLFQHLHKLSVAFYKRTKPGKISARLMRDVDAIKDFIQGELIKAMMNVLMLVVAIGFMVSLNWFLAVISVCVLPFHWLLHHLFKGSIKQYARQAKEQIGDISGDVIEQFTGMETVKSSVAEPKEQAKFRLSMKKGMSAQISQRRYYLLQKISADFLVGLGYALVLGVGGYAVMGGNLQVGAFIAVYSYARMLYPLVLELVNQSGKFSATAASFDRVYEIIHAEPDVIERPTARPYRVSSGRLEFQNVAFAYDTEEVLKDVSFSVEPGEHVLVTGPSGVGKTTLMTLIPRFYDPQRGRILLDGRDVRDYTLAALRDQVGIVLQDCFLFSSSVLENIRYARPEATDGEVVEACQRADAHGFITELPDGYFTLIGEGGIQLSAGERQRLVIARTILKSPVVLILDEALASLDPESRQRVSQGLLELAKSKTLFTVTHNLDIFSNIDKEIRLMDGRATVY